MRLLSTLTRSDHRHFPPPRAANSSPVHKSMATSMANFSFLLPRRVITITIIITPAIDNVFVRDLHSHRLWEPINIPIHQKKKTSSVHRHPSARRSFNETKTECAQMWETAPMETHISHALVNITSNFLVQRPIRSTLQSICKSAMHRLLQQWLWKYVGI